MLLCILTTHLFFTLLVSVEVKLLLESVKHLANSQIDVPLKESIVLRTLMCRILSTVGRWLDIQSTTKKEHSEEANMEE